MKAAVKEVVSKLASKTANDRHYGLPLDTVEEAK